MSDDAERLLQVEGLRIWFGAPSAGRIAVNGLHFTLGRGQIQAIVGESGSGKTLTALSILGLLPRGAGASGRILFGAENLLSLSGRRLRQIRGNRIAMVYQDPLSALNPVWSIGEQIAETIRAHRRVGRSEARLRTLKLLGLVGMPDPARVAHAYPHEFSGGMRQRALIAMALACEPEVLIADEPTTALDLTVQAQILELLLRLREELGLAILIITHDMGVVARLADRVLVMYAGTGIEAGPVDAIFAHPHHPYTRALLASSAMAHLPAKAPVPMIAGAPPALGLQPSGCPFRTRCDFAQHRCALEAPASTAGGDREVACHFPLGADGDG